MSTVINIRLEVDEETHDSILHIQSVIEQITGKKPAKGAIVLDIVKRNLADEAQACESVLDSLYQNRSIPLAYNGGNISITNQSKNLQKREDEVSQRERVVAFKEQIQADAQETKNRDEWKHREEMKQLDDMKFERLEYKHTISNKDYIIASQKEQIASLEAKDEKKQTQIEKLKDEKMKRSISSLNGNSNSSSNSFWETLKPFLLPIAAVVAAYLLGKNTNKTTFPPEFKQFVPYLEKLSDEQKKELGLYLEGILKNS